MEYYKVIKIKDEYTIGPTSKGLMALCDTKEFPHCFLSDIVKHYNFNLKDFFCYIISKFNATVHLLKDFPYFSISFPNKFDAQNFCKELNISR